MMKFNMSFKKVLFVSLSVFIMMIASSCALVFNDLTLDTPKNLRVVELTHDTAVIAWDKVSNAIDYEVQGTNISSGEEGFVYFPDEHKVKVENLDWDETYEVKIKARASGTVWDKYTNSDIAKITFTTKMPGVPSGELERPLNLKSVYENGLVTFSWDKVAGADFYEVSCEYYTPYNGSHRLIYERPEPVPAELNYLIDDRLPEEVSKICYRVCAHSKSNPDMKNWSKKNIIRIKNK